VPWNNPRADLERALDGPSSTVLGGTLDGSLVATAIVGHDGHRGWVYYLAVAPGARGQGYGRAMMGACERWLADRGVPKLNLMVRVGNEPVLGFYEALGYGRDEVVVMSRRLD
jgi:ribosomal protein S18 acetylase RimI-like enzyme